MKKNTKYIVIFITAFLCVCSSYSDDLHYIGKIDTNVLHRKNGAIRNMCYDSDSTFWYTGPFVIGSLKKGNTDAKLLYYSDLNDTTERYTDTPILDNYGNFISVFGGGVTVFDTSNAEEYSFKLNILEGKAEPNFGLSCQIGNRFYLRHSFLGFNKLYYLQYNEETKKWESSPSFVIEIPTNNKVFLAHMFAWNNKLFFRVENSFMIYDPETGKFSEWNDPNFQHFNGILYNFLGPVIDEKNNIATLGFLANKRVKIMRLFGTDSVKVYEHDHVLHPNIENNKLIPRPFGLYSLNKEKSIFFFSLMGFYIWSEKFGFKYIPVVEKGIMNDIEFYSLICGLTTDSYKELWVSGAVQYVYRFSIEKMLEIANTNFPYDSSSVDDSHSITQNSISNIYVDKNKKYLEFNYTYTDINNMSISIFDINGKEYKYSNALFSDLNKNIIKVKLDLDNYLPAGVYLLNVKENERTITEKLIIE